MARVPITDKHLDDVNGGLGICWDGQTGTAFAEDKSDPTNTVYHWNADKYSQIDKYLKISNYDGLTDLERLNYMKEQGWIY